VPLTLLTSPYLRAGYYTDTAVISLTQTGGAEVVCTLRLGGTSDTGKLDEAGTGNIGYSDQLTLTVSAHLASSGSPTLSCATNHVSNHVVTATETIEQVGALN
jgi:hypothetical protein